MNLEGTSTRFEGMFLILRVAEVMLENLHYVSKSFFRKPCKFARVFGIKKTFKGLRVLEKFLRLIELYTSWSISDCTKVITIQ